MKALRIETITLIIFLIATSTYVRGGDEEEAPGYRATYPNQVVQVDQLSIPPAHTRKGRCSYADTLTFISTRVSSTTTCFTDLIVGARRVRLGLENKVQPRESLYGVLGLNTEYRGIEDWSWIGNAVVQPRLVSSNIARSTRYTVALNGRYAVSKATGLHVGLYTELGMRTSLLHPLLGIDYSVGPWLFQAIYPIKAGISYQGFRSQVFSLMVRPVYTAIRLHKALHNRPGIGCYKATGAEFRWDFFLTNRWNFWAAVGSTVCGTLTLGDKNNNHRHHIHLHKSPYFNIGLNFSIG